MLHLRITHCHSLPLFKTKLRVATQILVYRAENTEITSTVRWRAKARRRVKRRENSFTMMLRKLHFVTSSYIPCKTESMWWLGVITVSQGSGSTTDMQMVIIKKLITIQSAHFQLKYGLCNILFFNKSLAMFCCDQYSWARFTHLLVLKALFYYTVSTDWF